MGLKKFSTGTGLVKEAIKSSKNIPVTQAEKKGVAGALNKFGQGWVNGFNSMSDIERDSYLGTIGMRGTAAFTGGSLLGGD